MNPEFWHHRWRDNEIAFHQGQINRHLQTFWPLPPPTPAPTVFVPLCGKSQDMAWLAAQGWHVLGVELSGIAIADFFRENRLTPNVEEGTRFRRYHSGHITLLEGDFFDLQVSDLENCTAAYDRASLIAFPPEMRLRYAQHLSLLLGDGAKTLLITLEYLQHEMQGPPFSVEEDEVRKLFGETMMIERLRTEDVLDAHERFKQRGLSALSEKVYWLRN